MIKPRILTLVIFSLLTSINLDSVVAANGVTENVVLITIDGLRWQDLFTGADERLLNRENGGVRDVGATRKRFWKESSQEISSSSMKGRKKCRT